MAWKKDQRLGETVEFTNREHTITVTLEEIIDIGPGGKVALKVTIDNDPPQRHIVTHGNPTHDAHLHDGIRAFLLGKGVGHTIVMIGYDIHKEYTITKGKYVGGKDIAREQHYGTRPHEQD